MEGLIVPNLRDFGDYSGAEVAAAAQAAGVWMPEFEQYLLFLERCYLFES